MQHRGDQPQPDDFTLMDRIVTRDQAAFSHFYDRHAGLVMAIGLRVLRDRTEAEQLLIDIFAELWDRADRFDASRGSPLTYLSTLTRSRSIDRLRARPKEISASLSSGTPADPAANESTDPVGLAMTDERRVGVIKALKSLDPVQRQVVELSFYDGLSHSEIADKLGKPLGTVKTHIRQGLIRMGDLLRTPWDGAPPPRDSGVRS